jgi:hypothetical protein
VKMFRVIISYTDASYIPMNEMTIFDLTMRGLFKKIDNFQKMLKDTNGRYLGHFVEEVNEHSPNEILTRETNTNYN